jgi:hypothetical protein
MRVPNGCGLIVQTVHQDVFPGSETHVRIQRFSRLDTRRPGIVRSTKHPIVQDFESSGILANIWTNGGLNICDVNMSPITCVAVDLLTQQLTS